MFITLNQRMLRNSEFVQFYDDVLEIYVRSGLEAPKLQTVINSMDDNYTTLKHVFIVKSGSAITEELTKLDDKRDTCLNGIVEVCDGYAKHYISDKKEAATTLSNFLHSYGAGVARLSYQSETSTLNDIVDKVKNNASLSKAANALGLMEWFDKMLTYNQEFNTVYLNRVQEQSEVEDVSMLDLRNQLMSDYKNMLNLLEAYTFLDDTGKFQLVVDNLNVLIEDYKKLLKLRSAKKTAVTAE